MSSVENLQLDKDFFFLRGKKGKRFDTTCLHIIIYENINQPNKEKDQIHRDNVN